MKISKSNPRIPVATKIFFEASSFRLISQRPLNPLFELDSIESWLLLDQTGHLDSRLGYRILVDDGKNIVYIAAWFL
jgi:hypothetical protein